MRVVVLNDGETYTSIEGCVVLDVPDDIDDEDLDDFVSDNYSSGRPIA